MPLTDTAIKNAKKREKPYKLSDGGGLHVLIGTDGSRYWRLAYRFLGKQKTLALGIYPAVPLADARAARDEAKKWLANRSVSGQEETKAGSPSGGGMHLWGGGA